MTSRSLHLRRCGASLGLLLGLVACGGEPPAAAPEVAAAPAPMPVPAAPPIVAAAPAGLNGEPVDVCALLSAADAAAVLGPLSAEPSAKPAQGSLLGECDYSGTNGLAMLSARPATEFDDTVRYASRRGASRELGGLSGAATLTPAGLMLQPQGRPYFIVINAVAFSGSADGLSEGLARKLNLGAGS